MATGAILWAMNRLLTLTLLSVAALAAQTARELRPGLVAALLFRGPALRQHTVGLVRQPL